MMFAVTATASGTAPRHAAHHRRLAGIPVCLLARTVLLGCALALCGCDFAEPEKRYYRIAVVGVGENDPLWPVFRAGMMRYAAAQPDLRLRFYAPPSVSPYAQAQILRRLLDDHDLAGVCIRLKDAPAIANPVERFRGRGVTVVTFNELGGSTLPAPHCGVDPVALGRAFAATLIEALHAHGTVLLLHAGDDDPHFGPVLSAFTAGLRGQTGLHLLASLDSRGDPEHAARLVADYTRRFPTASAWVFLWSWPLDAVTAPPIRWPDDMRVIAAPPLPRYWNFMAEGPCVAMIGADYEAIGYRALETCFRGVLTRGVVVHAEQAEPDVIWRRDLPAFQHQWRQWVSRTPSGGPPAPQPISSGSADADGQPDSDSPASPDRQ